MIKRRRKERKVYFSSISVFASIEDPSLCKLKLKNEPEPEAEGLSQSQRHFGESLTTQQRGFCPASNVLSYTKLTSPSASVITSFLLPRFGHLWDASVRMPSPNPLSAQKSKLVKYSNKLISTNQNAMLVSRNCTFERSVINSFFLEAEKHLKKKSTKLSQKSSVCYCFPFFFNTLFTVFIDAKQPPREGGNDKSYCFVLYSGTPV